MRSQILLGCLFLALARFSYADGMLLEKSSAANPMRMIEAPLTIPRQRAVVKWENGIETLLVESVVDGPKGVYGWVIPLPNRPSFVKPVSPSYISQSFANMMPPATTIGTYTEPKMLLFYGLGILIWLTAGYRYRNRKLQDRVLFFVLETVAMVFVSALLLPSMSQLTTVDDEPQIAAAAKSEVFEQNSAVKVESLGIIGSYDVNVVSGTDSGGILEWFRKRNYQVPNLALPQIKQYLDEGWVFLAAEVRKDRDEPWPPHPIKAVFPSKEPIYPMRLTGMQRDELRLELLVIAEKRAEVDGLQAWMCHDKGMAVGIGFKNDLEKEALSEWHEGLYAMAKYGMAATYLRGDLRPDQMKEDFKIEWNEYEPFRVDLWTTTAANSIAWNLFVNWLPLGGFLVALFGLKNPEQLIATLMAGIAASCVVASGISFWWKSGRTILDDDALLSQIIVDSNVGNNPKLYDQVFQESQRQVREVRALPTIPKPK